MSSFAAITHRSIFQLIKNVYPEQIKVNKHASHTLAMQVNERKAVTIETSGKWCLQTSNELDEIGRNLFASFYLPSYNELISVLFGFSIKSMANKNLVSFSSWLCRLCSWMGKFIAFNDWLERSIKKKRRNGYRQLFVNVWSLSLLFSSENSTFINKTILNVF